MSSKDGQPTIKAKEERKRLPFLLFAIILWLFIPFFMALNVTHGDKIEYKYFGEGIYQETVPPEAPYVCDGFVFGDYYCSFNEKVKNVFSTFIFLIFVLFFSVFQSLQIFFSDPQIANAKYIIILALLSPYIFIPVIFYSSLAVFNVIKKRKRLAGHGTVSCEE